VADRQLFLKIKKSNTQKRIKLYFFYKKLGGGKYFFIKSKAGIFVPSHFL
tara:strand:+ start:525 stop:674 length:150 start_codon:yes stop_codon:yes gene_type:complete